jgi:hypothetical protein
VCKGFLSMQRQVASWLGVPSSLGSRAHSSLARELVFRARGAKWMGAGCSATSNDNSLWAAMQKTEARCSHTGLGTEDARPSSCPTNASAVKETERCEQLSMLCIGDVNRVEAEATGVSSCHYNR